MEYNKINTSIITNSCLKSGYLLFIIILVLLLFIYIKWRINQREFDKKVAKIPHFVRPFPIIGHAHLFAGNSQQILEQLFRFNTFPTPNKVWLVHETLIIIKRPEDLQVILNSSKALEKHKFYRFMKPAMGEGLISAPVQKWKKNRKIITPTFKQNILDQFVTIFSKRAIILTDILKNETGSIIDASKFIFNYALDVLCETALGLDINSQIDDTCLYPKVMSSEMEIVWQRIFNIIYHPDFIFNLTKMSRDEKENVKFQNIITEKVIREKQHYYKEKQKELLEKPEAEFEERLPGKIFLEMLIELEATGVKFSNKELRDEVNTFMVAGTDTTATSGSFVFLMLALHKDVQEKVYNEVINVLGHDRPIHYYDLSSLVYLEKVIKETLRLFPIVPFIIRTLSDDIKLEKCIIPKSAGVVLGIGPMMRSEEYYENALEFNPERFSPEEVAKRHPYTFLPFSGGPRSCIGMRYGMMVLKTLIASIVRKFCLETTYKSVEDIKLMANIVMKPVKGFPLKLTERK